MARSSFALVMLAIASGVSLFLGLVGLYGVIAYIVSQRTREVGIRMALGAHPGDVQRLFLRYGLLLTAIGLVLGLGAAAALMRVMSALLFGVSPFDPVTYGAVAATLGLVAFVAVYLPARRATRVTLGGAADSNPAWGFAPHPSSVACGGPFAPRRSLAGRAVRGLPCLRPDPAWGFAAQPSSDAAGTPTPCAAPSRGGVRGLPCLRPDPAWGFAPRVAQVSDLCPAAQVADLGHQPLRASTASRTAGVSRASRV